jgi:hypothetical protein
MPCTIFPLSYFTDNCFVLCPTLQHIEIWRGGPLLILSSSEEKGRAADVISRKLEKQGAELVIFVQINTSMAPICLAGLTGLRDASSAG